MAWLVTFYAAARNLNFTKAAAELGLTQGAVSIQIRKLEQALDTALFERRGRNVVLTEDGHAYHPHVSEALDRLFHTTSRLFTGSRRNVVTLSCYSPTFADLWLAPRVPALMDSITELQLNISVDYQGATQRNEQDDPVFSFETGTHPQFLPLLRERLIAVATPAYLAARGPDWGRDRVIEGAGPRDSWTSWLAATGVTNVPDGRVIRVNSMLAALRLVRDGAGPALIADAFVKDLLSSGELVDLAPGKSMPGKMHGLSVRHMQTTRPICRQVMTALLAQAAPDVARPR